MKEEQTRYKAARSAQSACTITALAMFDILYAVQLSHHTLHIPIVICASDNRRIKTQTAVAELEVMPY